MVMTIIIADDKTGCSQCYRDDEVNMADILTPNALAIANVMVKRQKVEDQ